MESSREIVDRLRQSSFDHCHVTVVGYGNMGREYVKALQALGVGHISVCSRSKEPLEDLKNRSGLTTVAGGFLKLQVKPSPNAFAIISTSTPDLIPAALHLRELGFRRFLIEKPVALTSAEIKGFCTIFDHQELDVVCAYNRVAYPSVLEARTLIHREGGMTSCTYTFTEFTDRISPKNYLPEEAKRWGIANSLHVMSMAHGLIGLPERWACHRSGDAVAWHPAGSIFVGSGLSERGIPFSYHADWGSQGRWSVELHSAKASYRFCPLEKLLRRTSWKEDWKEVPVQIFAPDVKVGFVEQVAAMLQPEIRKQILLFSLKEALALTEFGEEVFGYV